MSAPQSVLVVEDEQSIASFVSLYLKNAGYTVRAAATGSSALNAVAAETPSLILLDLNLPDMDGIEICRRIRKSSDVPILMLTARDEDVDKIIGLEVGADDYLTKPFNPRELVARVKAVLRRSSGERRRDGGEEIRHGDLVDQRRPPRGVRRRRRDPARAEGVRPALGAARPPRSRADARPAARARLGLHLRGRHAHRRRARAPDPPQARRRVADRDRLGRRLQGRLGPERRRPRPRRPRRRVPFTDVPVAALPAAGALPARPSCSPACCRRPIALQLFRGYTREPDARRARREASGLAQLYADAALRAADEGAPAPDFAAGEARARHRRSASSTRAPRSSPGRSRARQRVPESSLPPDVRERSTGPLRFEFTPPGESDDVRRRCRAGAARAGRPSRSASIVVATPKDEISGPWAPLVARLAVAFAIGGVFAGLLSLVAVAADHGARARSSREAADQIAAGNYAVVVPPSRGGDEISHLSERFGDMAARLAATEERERQFLMSVSHELRTPLTAIHGHVDAIRDGLVDDPALVRESLDVVASEATRLERLVGDVLDLAKLRAHRFTVQTEEVDMGRLVEHAYGVVRGRGAAPRDRLPTARGQGDPDDHHRRRPRPPGDHEPAHERVPLDARRRHHRARDATSPTAPSASTSSTPGRGSRPRTERIFRPFVSRRHAGDRARPADRPGAGRGARRAVELESEPGRGSRFRLVLPARRP